MLPVVRAYPLYKFLHFTEESGLEKNILDCGAGGNLPPLLLFHQYGYQTTGIDISSRSLARADQFTEKYGVNLNIVPGDMRELKFPDESFSFAYSYNSIFHMSKEEIKHSVNQIFRVLKSGGLTFINLLSIDDAMCGEGEKIGENEFIQEEDNKVVHSFHRDNEADSLFAGQEIIHREKRYLERIYDGRKILQVFIDYIGKKV